MSAEHAVIIRPYQAADAAATLDVFLRAIRETASQNYTPAQINAWASADIELDEWAEKRGSARTVVATLGGRVVGFSDLDSDGYIDMLFVDPSAARRGVASALLARLCATATDRGMAALTTHSSVTARPFFEANGFTVTETRQPVVRGVTLTNHAMRRVLAAHSDQR